MLLSVQEIASLASKAARPPIFGFADLAEALRVGSQLVERQGKAQRAEFYIKFGGQVSVEEMHALKELASRGISILWDPDLTKNTALIGDAHYVLEKGGLRSLGPTRFRFSKAGFFGVERAKAVRAQRLEEAAGFAAILTLQGDKGMSYPLFLSAGTLPHGLRSGDTVEAAYLSVVGERTVAGWDAPAEVFLEALTIELLHSSPNHPPLLWVTAREAIDRILSGFEQPPTSGGRKMETWQKAATAAVTSGLRKEKIYMDTGDERYMYAEIGKKAKVVKKHVELYGRARETA